MTGLKSKQVRALERLYRRKVPPRELIHLDLGREMAAISAEISRQIGLLVDRQGVVRNVIVGDARGIEIPDLGRARAGTSRLRGLRCIHTHLKPSPLSQEDLTDLALLRLDAMAAIEALGEGETGRVHVAYLLPASADEESAGETPEAIRGGDEETPPWEQSVYPDLGRLDLDISALISSLEEEFSRRQPRGSHSPEPGVRGSPFQPGPYLSVDGTFGGRLEGIRLASPGGGI